jgi:hypothetical protein
MELEKKAPTMTTDSDLRMQEEKPKPAPRVQNPMKILQKRIDGRKKRNKKKLKADKQMEVEKNEGKPFKELLSQKYDSLLEKSGAGLATAICKMLKEQHKDLIHRIVEAVGDDKAREFVKLSVISWFNGGVKREDNQDTRSFGGIFIKLAKEHIDSNEPMKMKDVFRKSVAAISKRNIVKSRRRKERRKEANNILPSSVPIKVKNKKDASKNMFSSLAN